MFQNGNKNYIYQTNGKRKMQLKTRLKVAFEKQKKNRISSIAMARPGIINVCHLSRLAELIFDIWHLNIDFSADLSLGELLRICFWVTYSEISFSTFARS